MLNGWTHKVEQEKMTKLAGPNTMDIDSAQWTDLLVESAVQLDIDLSRHQAERFQRHAHMLLEWNRKKNLTAIADPVQVAVKHYLDSIAPLAHLSFKGEVLDLGTGGGFPGIPLKIMQPRLPMTLIDGTRKKIHFVKHAIRQLRLTQIEALQERAEIIGTMPSYMGRYDTVVCRAVSEINKVAMLALPLLAADGRIVVYKGPRERVGQRLTIETRDGPVALRAKTISYELPIFNDRRRVVVLDMLTN